MRYNQFARKLKFKSFTWLFLMPVYFGNQVLALDLDPEKNGGDYSKKAISVLENRHFKKANRPEIGFMVGSLLNEAYLDTTTHGLRIGYFFSEWLGVEVQYLSASSEESSDRKHLTRRDIVPWRQMMTILYL